MRAIKFRTWDYNSKKMDTNPLILPGKNVATGLNRLFNSAGGVKQGKKPDYNYVWMQFTGLTDRSGAEIYEGDIADYHYSVGAATVRPSRYEVVWQEAQAGFFLRPLSDDIPRQLPFWKQLEVIGNRYENPDLLTP